jgi:hypothetical protein
LLIEVKDLKNGLINGIGNQTPQKVFHQFMILKNLAWVINRLILDLLRLILGQQAVIKIVLLLKV